MRAAVARLGIEHPVCLDTGFAVWRDVRQRGLARALPVGRRPDLAEYHFGEGGYAETELAIQELLGVEREPLAPLHPEDDPEARIVVPTPDQPGAYSGPYAAGAVWAVLEGAGSSAVNGAPARSRPRRAAASSSIPTTPRACVELRPGAGVTVHADLLHAGSRATRRRERRPRLDALRAARSGRGAAPSSSSTRVAGPVRGCPAGPSSRRHRS